MKNAKCKIRNANWMPRLHFALRILHFALCTNETFVSTLPWQANRRLASDLASTTNPQRFVSTEFSRHVYNPVPSKFPSDEFLPHIPSFPRGLARSVAFDAMKRWPRVDPPEWLIDEQSLVSFRVHGGSGEYLERLRVADAAVRQEVATVRGIQSPAAGRASSHCEQPNGNRWTGRGLGTAASGTRRIPAGKSSRGAGQVLCRLAAAAQSSGRESSAGGHRRSTTRLPDGAAALLCRAEFFAERSEFAQRHRLFVSVAVAIP